MAALKQEKEAYKRNIDNMQNKLITARETIESKKTTIDTLEQEKSVLKQDMSVLKARYEELREAFKDVARDIIFKNEVILLLCL